MVTVVDCALRTNKKGEEFITLILQSGLEMIKSQATGQYYATAKRAFIPSTFDEATCKAFIGEKIDGSIQKVPCEPYEFTIPETGEAITLNHRWTYLKEGETIEEAVFEGKVAEFQE